MSIDIAATDRPDIDPDQMLSIADLAKMLRLSPRTIKRWLANGVAPKHYYVGASVRFYRYDVMEFIKSGEAASARSGQIASGE